MWKETLHAFHFPPPPVWLSVLFTRARPPSSFFIPRLDHSGGTTLEFQLMEALNVTFSFSYHPFRHRNICTVT